MIIETDLSKVTPETHRFVGMFRRPFSEVLSDHRQIDPSGYLKGGLRFSWTNTYGERDGVDKLREDWLAGHFDTPQYERIVPEPDLCTIVHNETHDSGGKSQKPSEHYADRTRLTKRDVDGLQDAARYLRIIADLYERHNILAADYANELTAIILRGTSP
jgi:hypothetical protein